MDEAKPFKIPQREVWEAFKVVKAHQGAAGVASWPVAKAEQRSPFAPAPLQSLRTSSGTDCWQGATFLRQCDGSIFQWRLVGRDRLVADRIAQEVARRYLEPIVEPMFHRDSYGYRPGKSAIDAVRAARERCWRSDGVLDLDIKAFFDSIDWELMLRAPANIRAVL